MRPYAKKSLCTEKRIFNYRLSRARRVIENTFGIMASRFRIFRKPIIADVKKVEYIIKAAVCLHNYLKIEEGGEYCPNGLVDWEENGVNHAGSWRNSQCGGLIPIQQTSSNMYGKDPAKIRDQYCQYFNSSGAVSWQLRAITKL